MNSDGQSMTELALVLPILLLVMIGIIEFGRMLAAISLLSYSAREASRYASVSGLNSGTPQYLDCSGIREAARGAASALVALEDSDIFVGYDHGELPTFAGCTQGVQPTPALTGGDRVVITVSANLQFLTPFLKEPFPTFPISFTSSRPLLIGGIDVTAP